MKKIISKHNKLFAVIAMITGMLAGAMMPLQSIYAQGTAVRVFFHIYCNSNGGNCAVTEAQVQSEFNQLQTDFAPGGICFINMGVDYIFDSNYDVVYLCGGFFEQDSITKHRMPGCINVYYHHHIFYCDPPEPRAEKWYNTNYNYDLSVSSIYVGLNQPTSFGIASALNLLPTWWYRFYFGNPIFENIDGSNAATDGDEVTDTPADPWTYYVYNPYSNNCFLTSSCCYTGTCQDPNGQSNFTPPYTNLMAEWWNLGWTPLTLTPGQFNRINYYVATGGLPNDQSAANTTIAPGNYAGGVEARSAIDVLNTSGTVHMYGTYKTTNIGGTVLLEPGFRANPSAGGQVIFKGHACGYITPRLGSEINSNVIAEKGNSLKCYPNPFSGNLTVEFKLAKDDHASIKLYNMMGKEMKAISKSFYAMGKHQITIDATDIAAGIYFVVLQSSDFKQEQKIVKVK